MSAALRSGDKVSVGRKRGVYLRARPRGMVDVDLGEGFVRRVSRNKVKKNPAARRKAAVKRRKPAKKRAEVITLRPASAKVGPDLLGLYKDRTATAIAVDLMDRQKLSAEQAMTRGFQIFWSRAKKYGWVERPSPKAKFQLTPHGVAHANAVLAKPESPKLRRRIENMLSKIRRDKHRLLMELNKAGDIVYVIYPKPTSGQQVYKTRSAAEKRTTVLNAKAGRRRNPRKKRTKGIMKVGYEQTFGKVKGRGGSRTPDDYTVVLDAAIDPEGLFATLYAFVPQNVVRRLGRPTGWKVEPGTWAGGETVLSTTNLRKGLAAMFATLLSKKIPFTSRNLDRADILAEFESVGLPRKELLSMVQALTDAQDQMPAAAAPIRQREQRLTKRRSEKLKERLDDLQKVRGTYSTEQTLAMKQMIQRGETIPDAYLAKVSENLDVLDYQISEAKRILGAQ